jgi:hypothetical protein
MTYVEMTPSNVEPSVRKEYEQLLSGMKTVERYQCPLCRGLEDNKWSITRHLLGHAIDKRIEQLWEQGATLKRIDDLYHVFCAVYPNHPESYDSFLECHHNITKDNCFTISYLQCCDYPAYRITKIDHAGKITVWGIGRWDGGYECQESLGCLRNPKPTNELYVYKSKYKQEVS